MITTPGNESRAQVPESPQQVASLPRRPAPKLPLLAVPLAAVLAFAIHAAFAKPPAEPEAREYSLFLGLVFLLSIIAGPAQFLWPAMRRWLMHMGPIMAAALIFFAIWEVMTVGLHWLPMPYFPGPGGVLHSLISERSVLFDSAWHSFLLLLFGYALGVAVALVTGICIGWFAPARYWGMPLLKVIGPIPATAWIPLAMVLSPSATLSAVGLIALAVWFPVTMLTASGVSNTRASYLDVARTLGAGQAHLSFGGAIPAAPRHICIVL